MKKVLLIVLLLSNILFADNLSIDENIEFLQEKLSFNRSPAGIGEKEEYLVKINEITKSTSWLQDIKNWYSTNENTISNHEFSFIYRIIYYKVRFGDKIEPEVHVHTSIPLKELDPSKIKIDFFPGLGNHVNIYCKYDKKCIYTLASDISGLTGHSSGTMLYTKTKEDAEKIKRALIYLIQKSGGTSEPY